MISLFLYSLCLGIICGLLAAVYRGILAYEEPFTWWWKFGNRFEGSWFFRPIWVCEKCFAGQLALWIYFFRCLEVDKSTQWAGFLGFLPFSLTFQGYSLLGHLFAVAVAIYGAMVFIRIINKTQ